MSASYSIPFHVRSVHNADGVVLLNIHSGAYFALNTVASLVWEQLRGGGSRETALEALQDHYGAPRERLARDVDALLARLQEKGLLAQGGSSTRPGIHPPPTPRPVESPPASLHAGPTSVHGLAEPGPQRFALLWRPIWFLLSFASLLCIDLMLRLRGFERFHHTLRRWPTRAPRRVDARAVSRICAAVDQAAGFYFKRAWCLQRSAATTCLLRLRGFPAHLVIGVHRMPFAAHAWVELDGRVVNDEPRMCSSFEVIERC